MHNHNGSAILAVHDVVPRLAPYDTLILAPVPVYFGAMHREFAFRTRLRFAVVFLAHFHLLRSAAVW